MRKLLTAGLAALTLGASVLATTAPATAAPFHGFSGHGFSGHGFSGYRGYGYRGYGAGPAIAAGIFGLAIGAAIADSGPRYYGPGPYAYGPGPYYDSCYAPQRVWDPYAGRYVIEQVPYAC